MGERTVQQLRQEGYLIPLESERCWSRGKSDRAVLDEIDRLVALKNEDKFFRGLDIKLTRLRHVMSMRERRKAILPRKGLLAPSLGM